MDTCIEAMLGRGVQFLLELGLERHLDAKKVQNDRFQMRVTSKIVVRKTVDLYQSRPESSLATSRRPLRRTIRMCHPQKHIPPNCHGLDPPAHFDRSGMLIPRPSAPGSWMVG